jgi:hypothetical protein
MFWNVRFSSFFLRQLFLYPKFFSELEANSKFLSIKFPHAGSSNPQTRLLLREARLKSSARLTVFPSLKFRGRKLQVIPKF